MTMTTIEGLSYTELFVMDEGKRIMAAQGGRERLLQFACDTRTDPFQRLLAVELLGSTSPLDANARARLHAEAITETPTHNPWGLPGEPEAFGESLLRLGAAVEPVLRTLLDNESLLLYEGSEEPTIASHYHYRVADLAAGLLAVHRGIEWLDEPDPALRDEWIRVNLVPADPAP